MRELLDIVYQTEKRPLCVDFRSDTQRVAVQPAAGQSQRQALLQRDTLTHRGREGCKRPAKACRPECLVDTWTRIERLRRHSPEFKAAVVAECCRHGLSIAAVALANGLNTNLVRRRVIAQEHSGAMAHASQPEDHRMHLATNNEGFVPDQIEPGARAATDIRVEIRRVASLISVSWPLSVAAECGLWLRTLLR